MKGKTLNQFVDELYYNAEIEFILNRTKYIISGWSNDDGTYTLSLCSIEENPTELFNYTSESGTEVVENFENAKIFNGKTVYDVEKNITVIYG